MTWLYWCLAVSISLAYRRAGGLPYDAVLMQGLWVALWPWILHDAVVGEEGRIGLLILGTLLGLCMASVERFCIGTFYHQQSREVAHETFHQMLRARKVDQRFRPLEHWTECYSYALLFACIESVLWTVGVSYAGQRALWLGMLTEHVVGQWLRLLVQYDEAGLLVASRYRFMRNIQAYYWYHILVDPHTCYGFSAPFWDTLCGSNPFRDRLPLWRNLPLPFFEFFLVDYTPEMTHIQKALLDFKRDPCAFQQSVLNKIAASTTTNVSK